MKNTVLILMLMFSCCMVGQDVLVTQNLDATFVNVNGSNRCRTNSGIYFDNYFARAFDLQNDHGIDTDFKINEVDFGVRFGKDMIVYVNIYTANTTDLSDSSLMLTPVSALNTISYEFSSMLGTNIVNISQATVITIPILNPVVIPAGEILVVEVFAPNSGTATNQDFAMGSNTSGQTKPSYVKAPICFNTNFFTNASSFGADGQSYVMAVRGEPPFDYEFTSGFDNNFITPSNFADGAAGAAIRSLTVQADAASQEYIIQGTSADTTIHKWFNTTSPLNEEFVLNYGDASSSNSNLSNPAVINRHYTFQIQGFALPNSPRNAVIMQTDNAPVGIVDLTYDANVSENQDVVVTVNLSGAKSPQEKAFIRYSKDNFATSELVEVQFPTPTSASGTATIPASFNTSGVVQLYAYTTTVNATPTSNHDLIALRIKKNGNLFYTYPINNTYQTQAGASVWSVPTSWEGNQVPPPNANVTIKHILNLTDNRQVTNLEVQDGITLNITTGDTLTIQNNGQITTTGSTGGIISGAGVVNFAQNGSILNKLSVAHVNLASAGVSFGTQCTITGSLTLNSGSFVDFNAPIYGPNSTLIYNNGGVFGRSAEWTNPNLTQGNPAHVRIQNNTTLDLGSSTNKNVPAVITGNLTIESGCALYMDYNGNNMRAPLIVEGNFVNNGAISLSDNTFDPEPNNNGNLKVFGDFTNNGTFTFNNRALIFEGNEVQNLTAAPNFPIPYLLINKTAGEVVLNQDIVINGNSGTALNMSNQGILNLNGHQLQIGDNTITYVEFLDNAALKGSTDSKILFKSTNSDSGSLKFKNEGFDNYLSEFEMDGNGAISLSDTLNILRRFVLKNGTFNSNGNLTFKSSESLTAIIPEVTDVPGVSINGDIRVERHYPMGNRAFRYVSSPVTSAATIHEQWQEGQNNANTSVNYDSIPGFGTHITGSQTGANGFDATETGNPSLFTWDNSVASPAWAPIPNTNGTTLEAGKAYALMMRGDRSTNLNSNSATGNSTVLRSWGEPIIGEHTVSTSINDTLFALIGNPYQAQVDLTKVEKSGFGNFFYIWDPTIGTRGGYAAVQIDGTTVTVTTTPSETTQANQFLQVGQAFFIQATADNPSITFQESHKSDATDNLTTFSMPNYANINVNLYRNGNQMVDGLRISLSEDFDDDVDFEDAVKLWNEQEYLAIDKNQSWLMVEKRTIPENDTIRLFSGNYMANDYQLKIDIQQLDTHEVYVHDAYLNESQLVSNNQQHTYSFSVDASLPESVHPSRFSLFFNPLPLSSEMPSEANRITTYPNPVTHGELYMAWPIQSSSQSTHVEVFDVFGKKVHAQTFSSPEPVFTIKLSHLPTGMYVLKAKQEKQVYTTKIIVE